MPPSAELLWRLNREYVNRLVKARNYLGLLEHVVLTRSAEETRTRLLPTLQITRDRLNQLSEAHRGWCYAYFYESAESKRMVQNAQAVRRALNSFGHMRAQNGGSFDDLAATLYELPRPAPAVTRLPNGDLWEMVQVALYDLINLDASLEN
ncbi:MAG: hypothetical protein ABI835_06360 [Chloroflexota bacterium]